MTNKFAKGLPLTCIILFAISSQAQTVSRSRMNASTIKQITLTQVLSWLPADTESTIGVNGPFQMPRLVAQNAEIRDKNLSVEELKQKFEVLPLALFGLQDGLLLKQLKGRTVVLALEGARHFKPPTGLGEMPFEGCEVAVFADPNALKAFDFGGSRFEQIAGQKVTVFQEKHEGDVWTEFVVFPLPNVAIIATSREYLQVVLARINGAVGPRALPKSLDEWKYVDVHALAWGLRHYESRDSNLDPTSPIGGNKAADFSDDKGIGIVFTFDPDRRADVTYLSGADNLLEKVRKDLFPINSDPTSIKALKIRYALISPGAVRMSFVLVQSEAVDYFLFNLLALVGHAIYL